MKTAGRSKCDRMMGGLWRRPRLYVARCGSRPPPPWRTRTLSLSAVHGPGCRDSRRGSTSPRYRLADPPISCTKLLTLTPTLPEPSTTTPGINGTASGDPEGGPHGHLYLVFSDRKSLGDLDRCLFLLPTEEQERRYSKALSGADLRPLVKDPEVERCEMSLDFLSRVFRSHPPRS